MANKYVEQAHHFVPRAYFRPWEQAERKVLVYERIDGKVVLPYWQSTKKICVQPGLYAYTESVQPEKRNVLEEKLFQRIDNVAASALSLLNSCDNINEVPAAVLHSFAIFLVSLRIRTPEFFGGYSRLGEARLRKLISEADNDPQFEDLRASFSNAPFIEIAEKYHKADIENKSSELLAEGLINGRLVNPLLGLHCSVISIPQDITLVTSDRPLISKWANDTISLVALAISPTRAFVACHSEADLDKLLHYDKLRLAQMLNISSIQQAKTKAFASDKSHSLRFFERRLGVSHSILPFSTPVDPDLLERRILEEAELERTVKLRTFIG